MDEQVGVVDQTLRRVRVSLEREHRIAELQRQINRLQAEIVQLAAEADAERDHVLTGFVTTAEWLAATTNVAAKTARSWVRVARKTQDLPMVVDAMANGHLGVDQAAAIARFLDPDVPPQIQRDYFDLPADELLDIARDTRRVSPDTVLQQRADRSYTGRFTDDGLRYEYDGVLPAADGAVVDKALRRLGDRDRITEHGAYKDYEWQMADALVEMASSALGEERDPDRSTVIVHVKAEAFADSTRVGYTEDDAVVPMSSVRRMLCDARLQVQLDDANGAPLGVGRTQRTIPPWLQRMVRERDRTCRFPGCRRRRWVHSHHMVHWADGGPTDLRNLVTLCGFHHRVLHEEQWSVRFDGSGKLVWTTIQGYSHRKILLEESVVGGERLRRLAAGRSLGTDPPSS